MLHDNFRAISSPDFTESERVKAFRLCDQGALTR